MTRLRAEGGFSLIELMVATGVMLVVSSVVTGALVQMGNSQKTITNRTAMHSGVRGATELLQQEVGQAGRIALPTTPTLSQNVAISPSSCNALTPVVVQVSSVQGMFVGMVLTTLDGDNQETIWVRAINASASPPTFSSCFLTAHTNGTKLFAPGGFATGIVPPSGIVNGSTATKLKMYGDINSDGSMVYVEYTCDQTATHNLYRNVMAFDATSKPGVGDAQILLSNILPNPGGTDCFQYQTSVVTVSGTPFTFVLDVAITLTVETEQLDPITNSYQTETKALLNVSPRNVFNTWAYAGIGYTNRIQSTPTSIQALLDLPE